MIHQVALARTDHGVGEGLVDFQRTRLYPLAVLPVAALLGNLADIDFGVEVGGESLAVVAGIAVHDVEGVHFAEVVLGGIGGIDAAHARVKTATQDGGQPGLLKALAVSPLPAVLKVCLVARLIVGSVQIIHTAAQTGFHDGQVLIGKGQIDDHVGTVTLQQGDELVHIVGVHLVGGDVVLADGACHGITLGAVARGNHDLVKHVRILRALVGAHGADTTASNDNDFAHNRFLNFILSRKYMVICLNDQIIALFLPFFHLFGLDC